MGVSKHWSVVKSLKFFWGNTRSLRWKRTKSFKKYSYCLLKAIFLKEFLSRILGFLSTDTNVSIPFKVNADHKWPNFLSSICIRCRCISTLSFNVNKRRSDYRSGRGGTALLRSFNICYLFAVSNNPKKLRYDFHILIGMLDFIPEIVNSFVYFEVKTCSRWKWRSGDDLTMSAITEKEHFKKDA